MKQKKLETILYSVVGVAVMLAIIVAVNFISGAFKTRVDMTADKLYTLSPGTKAILSRIDSPVEIRFYSTRGEGRVPAQLRSYAQQVEDLLGEFQQASHGKIEVKKFDPLPDSDAEEKANFDGVEGQMMPNGENFYLGIAISLDPQKVALPFLSPEREKLLEYDLARALSRVLTTNKPVVGVMTPLPMFGQPMNPMMARMGQQPQESWVFIDELKSDFEVRQVPMTAGKIDNDVKVLIVAHPKDISDSAQYAIDQFIMGGGKLIALLDAMSLVDSKPNPMMGQMPGGGSSLDKLLKAWGIQFENSKVIADMTFAAKFVGRDGRPDVAPTVLSLNSEGINAEDALTSQLDNLLIPFAGVFTGTPVAGLKQTVLLKTSAESQLVDGMMAQMSGRKVVDEFKASGTSYALAIRLEGKFKTAFPDGKPAAAPDPDAKKDETKKDEKKPDDSLKETKRDNAVILVGDADFIYDQFSAQVQKVMGQRVAMPRNGNLPLVQNMVEQLSGDSSLIGARSRASVNRPFTLIRKMEASAEKNYQAEIKRLEDDLAETQRRLNELQTKKEAGQRFILSPEQQEELKKFKQKEGDAKKHLKEVRKNLRQDVDSLQTRLKWANIAGMPLLVAAAGILLAVIRKQRTKAT